MVAMSGLLCAVGSKDRRDDGERLRFRIPYRIPYRWQPSTIWFALTDGIANVFRWVPVIWSDSDYDYAFLLRIMEYKLRRMAAVLESGHLLDGPRRARQARVCAELCKRMHEDRYCENADIRYPGRGKTWASLVASQESLDEKLLGRLIGKHLRSWWD